MEGRKEEHAEIAELMKGAREKERDYDKKVRSGENLAAYFREKITELEREKEDLGGEYDGFKDRAAGLKEENEGWVKEVEGLRRKNLDLEGEMGG
jgi:chromosome segregation ATPase